MNLRVEKTLAALRSGDAGIGVWGCGHIGASAMDHFSRQGVWCVGYDITEARVRDIRQGRFLATDTVDGGDAGVDRAPVRASTRWRDMLGARIAVHIIAVPTERGAEPSSAALEDVMPLICEVIRSDESDLLPLLVVESTIQPTWIDTVILPTLHASGLNAGENVLLGAAPRRDWFSGGEHTIATLPRVVGGSTPEALDALVGLYSLVCNQLVPSRDAYHAAFTKVIENLIRFQGLALANSLSLAFPQYDMTHVFSLASTKWNIPYYHPSMGIGGHCIPLAPRYTLAEGGLENPYLQPVRDAVDLNENFFRRLYEERLVGLLADCRSIAVLGLAYTADAKMHKLSAALDAIECLRDTPRLRLHDPYYSDEEVEDLCGVAKLSFPDDLPDCDGIVLVTPHTLYKEADITDAVAPGTRIVDNFGTWKDKVFQDGVRYHEVGRPRGEDSRHLVGVAEPRSTVSA